MRTQGYAVSTLIMLCTTLQKELREIERDKASGVTVQLKSSNLQRLTGFVEGRPFRVPSKYGPSNMHEPHDHMSQLEGHMQD